MTFNYHLTHKYKVNSTPVYTCAVKQNVKVAFQSDGDTY